MFDAEYGKSEVDEYAHNDREDELPLHPETDLGLRAAPEVEHIFLILFGGNNVEEIINARLDNRKVEREDDDEDEREDASEYPRNRAKCVAEGPADIKNASDVCHDVVRRNCRRSGDPQNIRVRIKSPRTRK